MCIRALYGACAQNTFHWIMGCEENYKLTNLKTIFLPKTHYQNINFDNGFFLFTHQKGGSMKAIKPNNKIWKRHPVKMTALLYLRDALLNEAYEQCEQLVRIARDFGATDMELKLLLEDPRRAPG
ncbi:MAG: hypothetical protein ACI9CF_000220 [Candidatus Omnitrophota bacterium]|jgi:hypothetical protein